MIIKSSLDASSFSSPSIVFECNDFRRDIVGLILLKRKSDSKFELYLHNDYLSLVTSKITD